MSNIKDRMRGYNVDRMFEIYEEEFERLLKKKAALQREFDELEECDEIIHFQLSKELSRAKHK